MGVSSTDMKLLWARAGNQCSMPGCTEVLVTDGICYGEVAHIRASSPEGPRGTEIEGPDTYDNLILLCRRHHRQVDASPEEWPPERLALIKQAHEDSVQSAIQRWKQHSEGRSLIVFCGPSSVGKDVVASRVRRDLQERFGFDVDFLDKYTTRRRRSSRETTSREDRIPGSLYEPSSTYEFLTDDELQSSDDCFFPYRKYGKHLYAFSRNHLQSRAPEDRHLACILGALDRILAFKRAVERESNRHLFAVLLEAEVDELQARLDLRSTFSSEERERRREEIWKDVARIHKFKCEGKTSRSSFDLTLYNGRARLDEVVRCISDGVGQWLRWREWEVAPAPD
jgi:guanylate kinase